MSVNSGHTWIFFVWFGSWSKSKRKNSKNIHTLEAGTRFFFCHFYLKKRQNQSLYHHSCCWLRFSRSTSQSINCLQLFLTQVSEWTASDRGSEWKEQVAQLAGQPSACVWAVCVSLIKCCNKVQRKPDQSTASIIEQSGDPCMHEETFSV